MSGSVGYADPSSYPAWSVDKQIPIFYEKIEDIFPWSQPEIWVSAGLHEKSSSFVLCQGVLSPSLTFDSSLIF